MTFSIVAIDTKTGACGSAVASYSIGVGGTVSYSRVGVGVINTQHHAHLAMGHRVLERMDAGATPHDALSRVLEGDPDADSRQLIVIDARGRRSAWTGRECAPESRHQFGAACVAAGNFLASGKVVEKMIEEFEASAGSLADRLLQALAAGERQGGDRRGRKAAAVSVLPAKGDDAAINVDLRVDAHENPVAALVNLRALFREEFRQ